MDRRPETRSHRRWLPAQPTWYSPHWERRRDSGVYQSYPA
jgi:hypothetical protein